MGSGNFAQGGGVATMALIASNCTIDNINKVNGSGVGGGVFLLPTGSPSTIAECTISGNQANSGGGIYSKYALTVRNSTIAFTKAAATTGRVRAA